MDREELGWLAFIAFAAVVTGLTAVDGGSFLGGVLNWLSGS